MGNIKDRELEIITLPYDPKENPAKYPFRYLIVEELPARFGESVNLRTVAQVCNWSEAVLTANIHVMKNIIDWVYSNSYTCSNQPLFVQNMIRNFFKRVNV